MNRLIGIVCVALLIIAGPSEAKFRGPISGVVETSDGRSLTDVVVQLKCSAQGIQRNVTSESETRIVETGKRFRVLWAWAGLAPAAGGCRVQVHHPLYVSATVRAADDFTIDLGVIELEPYLDVLSQQPNTAVVSPSRPWPFSLLYTHLRHAYSDFALVHPAKNRPEIITLLLNAGADIDRQRWGSGDTPLLEALQHRSDAATLLLLERDTDPAYAAWRGPPLRSALSQNARMPIIEALIAHGAIKNAREPRHIIAVFFAAATSAHRGPTLRRLVDAGISVDVRGERQQTALMLAAWTGRTESITTFLELGADPHAKDADGITAMDKAQVKGHDKIAQ